MAKSTKADAVQQERPLCLCGCGRRVIGAKARFISGDDGRLKGRLLKEARAGSTEAVERLEALGWGHFLVETKAEIAKRQKVEAAGREAAEKEATKTAPKPKVARGRTRRAATTSAAA